MFKSLLSVFFVFFFYVLSAQEADKLVVKNGKKYFSHSVVKGETIFRICKNYSVTSEQLIELNPSLSKGLQLGKPILIPYSEKKDFASNSLIKFNVLVESTLSNIASLFNLKEDELKVLNPNSPNQLLAGTQLNVPGDSLLFKTALYKSTVKVKPDTIIQYVIEEKDVLYSIAKRFMTSVKEIQTLNLKTNTTISPNSVLLIPIYDRRVLEMKFRTSKDLIAEQEKLKHEEEARKIKEIEDKKLQTIEEKEKQIKAIAEKARLQKEESEKKRLAAEQLKKEQLAKDKIVKDSIAKVTAENVRIQKEESEKKRLAAEQLKKEQLAKDQVIKDSIAKVNEEKIRIQKEESEKKRLAAEQLKKEQLAKAKIVNDSISKVTAEKVRIQKEESEKKRLAAEQLKKEQLAKAKIVNDSIAKVNAEKIRVQKEESEKQRLAAEQLKKEQLAKEKIVNDSIAKVNAEKIRIQKEESEKQRLAAEQLKKEQLARAKIVNDSIAKVNTEKIRIQKEESEKQRLAAEQLKKEQLAKEQILKDSIAKVTAEKVRIQKEESEKQRLAAEQLKKEQLAKAKIVNDSISKVTAEKVRIQKEESEKKRLAAEQLKKEQLAKDQVIKDSISKVTAEKIRIQKEESEKQRLAAEQLKKEQLAKDRVIKDSIAKVNVEKIRIQKEESEKQRLAAEQLKKEQLAKEQSIKDSIAKVTAEIIRVQKEESEKQRLAAEQLKKEQLAKDQAIKDSIAKVTAEKIRIQQEELEKQRIVSEQLEKERVQKEQLESQITSNEINKSTKELESTNPIQDSTQFKKKFVLTFLLPFNSDKQNDPTSKVATEFYMGVQLALDSLSKLKFKGKVNVLDCGNDTSKLNPLFFKEEVLASNLIIGPLNGINLVQTADFCNRNNIPMINPIMSNTALLKNNKFVYNAVSSEMSLVKGLAKYVYGKHTKDQVVLVKVGGKDEELYHEFRSNFSNQGSDKLYEVTDTSMLSVIKKDKKSIFVVLTRDKELATKISKQLTEHIDRNKLTGLLSVYGTKDWLNFEAVSEEIKKKIDFKYNSSIDFNSNNQNLAVLRKKFKEKFKISLTKYAAQGYDVTFYFVKNLLLKSTNEVPMMNVFDLNRIEQFSGFENGGSYVFGYEEGVFKRIQVLND